MCKLFREDRGYSPVEIAERLPCGKKTVYRMINNVEDPLPAYRLNGMLRVLGKDLNVYMENHRVEPENE